VPVLGRVRHDGIKNSVLKLKLKKENLLVGHYRLVKATFYMSVGVCVLGLK
jgi:hypothetical protein